VEGDEMFGELIVPRGCRAVVNGQLELRTRFHVGKYVPIYFVDASPVLTEIPVQARCKEGIEHTVLLTVRFSILLAGAVVGLEDLGYSDRSHTLTVRAEDLVKGRSVVATVKAATANYVHETGFLALADTASVTKDLKARVPTICSKAPLAVEIEHCDIQHIMPTEDLLAEIAAAGITTLADYFRDRIKQKEIIAAELEEARAAANSRIEKAKADVKISAIQENERIKMTQANFEDAEATRKKAAQERNSKILESGAGLDFAYKLKRLDEEKELTSKREELAQSKAKEEAATRLARQLDLELDIKCERERADIRKAERAALLGELSKVPRPDYGQVRTIVGSFADPVTSLLTGLLANLGDLGGESAKRQ
jgi:hypothetical protein